MELILIDDSSYRKVARMIAISGIRRPFIILNQDHANMLNKKSDHANV